MQKIGDWLDARAGHRALVRCMADQPVRGGARWAYVWGSMLLGCAAVQAVTGCAMMTVYAPAATTAWASVQYLSFVLPWGWLVRGIHHFTSHAMIIVAVLHLVQVVLSGAYKAPREVSWWMGLGLFGLTLWFALTGSLLPWDQRGYWATRLTASVVGAIPMLGREIQRVLVGGEQYGTLTLTRFYTLHVAVLPAMLAVMASAHSRCSGGTGSRQARAPTSRGSSRTIPRSLPETWRASCSC